MNDDPKNFAAVADQFRNAELKWSCYNVVSEMDDGAVVWNTRTGAIVLLDRNHVCELSDFFLQPGAAKEGSFVSEFAKLGFLAPFTLDERQAVASTFRQGEGYLQLTILPTTFCNFQCIYCYEDFSNSLSMSQEVEGMITSLVQKQFDMRPSIRTLVVSWFGGEPLINLGSIERLSSSFQKLCQSRGIAYSSGITTNGYLLDRTTFLDLVEHGVSSFQITLDGVAKNHNAHRPLRNGDATFETITGNLNDIARLTSDYQIVIRSNFDRDNVKEAEDFVSWFEGLFKNDSRFSFYFAAIYRSGTQKDECINFCSNGSEINDDISYVLDLALEHGILHYYSPTPEPKPAYCAAVMPNSLVIKPDGSLYKCTLLLNPKDRIGDLESSGDVTLTDNIDLWRDYSYANDTECKTCVLLPVCHGGCPNARLGGHRGCLCTLETAKRAMNLYCLSQKQKRGGE